MPVTAESLFQEIFLPMYPPGIDLAAARTTDANPGKNPSIVQHLVEAAEIFAGKRIVDVELDFSDASVHRLGAALTAEKRDQLIAEEELFNVVIHGAAYVGECIVRNHGGAWGVRRPLWESVVRLVSPMGEADLAVFHWWLKSLADGGQSLGARYRAHVEIPRGPGELPVITADRKLPRIAQVKYDVLYKYLKAHLPELKDLGKDFPSPERFAAYKFKWLEPTLVGGGRMLLLFGPGEGGAHLIWLDKNGFVKAAHYPADGFPEPKLKVDGDKLQIVTSIDQKLVVHETMWWGP
jgi:hypothetical protein